MNQHANSIRAIALSLVLTASVVVRAGDCKWLEDASTLEDAAKVLKEAPSCSAAADKMRECALGASGDSPMAATVVEKCEGTFLEKLSAKGKQHYQDELQLCAYEYQRQQGTMFISAAVLCSVDVAERFAANPALAEQPAPRASFDCRKAQTPLEITICSDVSVGRADRVLSRSYNAVLHDAKGSERELLIHDQKRWLQSVSVKCHLASGKATKLEGSCVREEFERRFSNLDGCVASVEECLRSLNSDDDDDVDKRP